MRRKREEKEKEKEKEKENNEEINKQKLKRLKIQTQFQVRELEDGGIVRFCYNFLCKKEAYELYEHLMSAIPSWTQGEVPMYGKTVLTPRLQAWMTAATLDERDTTRPSLYQKQEPVAWTPLVHRVKEQIEAAIGNVVEFDYLLINQYRNGKDYIAFHSDGEAVGRNPRTGMARNYVASLSLGQTRRFLMRHKSKKDLATIEYSLSTGSLLVMEGTTQEFWEHSVPKELKVIAPRLNLTFRVS